MSIESLSPPTPSEQGIRSTPETKSRPRRRRLLVLVGGLLSAGAVVAVALAARTGGGADGDTDAVATATAAVARRDLVQRDTVTGTLGFNDDRSVVNHRQGTITSLPEEGTTIERGGVLFRVNAEPVILFYGSEPAWRTLAEGVDEGNDVRQLERNLRSLGYDGGKDMTIDDEFDWATTNAVERWQEALGLDETGVVELGDVVFQPGARRVGGVPAAVGDRARPGAPVMTTTSTTRTVTATIEASNQADVHVGDEVVVDLLNGTTTPGTIIEVGKVAKAAPADGGSSTISFEVEVKETKVSSRLDQAPVEVKVTSEKAENVLSVPVTALLALRGGGYGVEVLGGGGVTRLVAVTPGLYSDGGFVEIEGKVKAGDKVVVPA
jgi:peptidoglycan hydrolase-like protein with peptidoglycan-binding domain